ncbi:MAG: HD domain-containing protein, partial [Candidatus Aminicenantes bacterium]|nr:HD domain-containing protein [Candidatus Aminicenantes bacterium]
MVKRRVLIYDRNTVRGQALAGLMNSLKAEAVSGPSLSRISRQALEDPEADVLVAVIGPLDGTAAKLLAGLKRARPGLSVIAGARSSNPRVIVRMIDSGVLDGAASPDDPVGLFSAVRIEIRKKEIEEQRAMASRALRRLKLERSRTDRHTRELEEIYESTLENLMTALDVRDVETFGHSRTVAKYTEALAGILGIRNIEKLEDLRKGALLHDIGKIAIPDAILNKPGPLSAAEWDKVRLHPALGYGLIREIKLVPEIGNIILFHHERFDGAGYPRGLAGNDIPREARIFAVADALDAITAHRPYRKPQDMKSARKEIVRNAGTHFDPEAVNAFCSLDLREWEKIRYETTKQIPLTAEFTRLVSKAKK